MTMKDILRITLLAAALAVCGAAAAQSPELELAQKQADANDLTAAANTLDAYLKQHPENATGWAKRGIVANQAHHDGAALSDYEHELWALLLSCTISRPRLMFSSTGFDAWARRIHP